MQQIWKDVKGYQGLYQVSNLGRVKSLNFNHTGIEKIMKQKLTRCGYLTISFRDNNIKKFKLIHRLVWEAFNGKIPQGLQVDHIDANKQNNKLDNLQLLTPSENIKKKFVDNPKLLRKIICLNNGIIYESQSQASRKLNLQAQNISAVLNGKHNQHHGYKFRYLDYQSNSKEEQYIQGQLF